MTGKNRATHLKGDNKTPESNSDIRSHTIKCFVFLIEFKVQFLLHNFLLFEQMWATVSVHGR